MYHSQIPSQVILKVKARPKFLHVVDNSKCHKLDFKAGVQDFNSYSKEHLNISNEEMGTAELDQKPILLSMQGVYIGFYLLALF